eukprot:scaffold55403_cov100-Phaeocystis_antarctica.AAC.4
MPENRYTGAITHRKWNWRSQMAARRLWVRPGTAIVEAATKRIEDCDEWARLYMSANEPSVTYDAAPSR